MVSENGTVESAALVRFEFVRAVMFGPPNDEAFSGHPLADRGLPPYGAFEVLESSWIRRLERINAVHPNHRPEHFADDRHFVLAFHDEVFECVANPRRGRPSTSEPSSPGATPAPIPGYIPPMPVHEPAPTQPTNKCPKCSAEGVVQQAVGPMVTYACPKCGARWVGTR